MAGIAFLLSVICGNSPDVCISDQNSLGVNFNVIQTSPPSYKEQMDKIKEELEGQTLNVTTLEDSPLSVLKRVDKGEYDGGGFAFEFFDHLSKKYNFNYNVIKSEYNIVGSSNDTEGSVLQLIRDKKVDVAVAFIPMMADLVEHVRFSTPLDEGEWKMIMKRPQESASGAGLLAPFDEVVWYFILVSLIVTGPCIFGIIWIYHRFGKHTGEPYYNLWQCVWYVYGGLMKQGSVLSPNADSIRVAFATWWIFITILTSFYTANLTAFLTLARFSLPINEPKDLSDKSQRFICHRGFAVNYAITNYDEELGILRSMLENKLGELVNQNNDTEILLNQVYKKNVVFIRDKPAIDHLVYDDYRKRKTLPSERLQCPFAMSKIVSLKRKRGFIYPKDSKWAKLFDQQLRYMVEGGIINHRLNYGLPKAEICPQNLGSIERQLGLNDLFTTYLTMLIGFSSALAIFVAEMIMRYFNGRKDMSMRERGIEQSNTRQILVKPFRKTKASFIQESTKTISPPPAYGEAIKTIFNTQASVDSELSNSGSIEGYRTLNGRKYAIIKDENGTHLVPTRSPSAALFNYQLAYNSYN